MNTPTSFTCIINGQPTVITPENNSSTVLEYLRACGLVGTKEGCGDGDCGACTIVIRQQTPDGTQRYNAVNSCLLPLAAIAEHDVITVEGVAAFSQHDLHPVQRVMVTQGGSQCGYCTPGFIMSMFAGYQNKELSDDTVEGNLCRCTGYAPIRRAINELKQPSLQNEAVTPAATTLPTQNPTTLTTQNKQQYHRPESLNRLLTLLTNHPDATLLAGGTDLGLEFSHKSREFPVVVSVGSVPELKVVREDEDVLEIGAGLSLSFIEKQLAGRFAALDEMLHWFAARQIRNRATLGGNIATASPIGDMAPVLLALGASLRLVSAAGERVLALDAFFTGYRQTALQPGEVIQSVIIPKTLAEGAVTRLSQSYKVAKRGTDDISTVAAVYCVDLSASNTVVNARLAYGGVAAVPARAVKTEAFLRGKPWQASTITQGAAVLATEFKPLDDFRASANYRQLLIQTLFKKFYTQYPATQQEVTA